MRKLREELMRVGAMTLAERCGLIRDSIEQKTELGADLPPLGSKIGTYTLVSWMNLGERDRPNHWLIFLAADPAIAPLAQWCADGTAGGLARAQLLADVLALRIEDAPRGRAYVFADVEADIGATTDEIDSALWSGFERKQWMVTSTVGDPESVTYSNYRDG